MSFSRQRYDTLAYQHQLNQVVGPGNYMLDTPNVCDPCFVPSPYIQVGGGTASSCERKLIDVDSELLGITRKASHCPSKHYIPSAKPFCELNNKRECNQLDSENTRLSNPPCTLRCRGWNRWEWLCRDPQAQVQMPFDWNINNRLVVKDNHRPLLALPVDPTIALPKSKPSSTEKFCGVPRDTYPLSWGSCVHKQ
jgi:hypothetical protein